MISVGKISRHRHHILSLRCHERNRYRAIRPITRIQRLSFAKLKALNNVRRQNHPKRITNLLNLEFNHTEPYSKLPNLHHLPQRYKVIV